MLVDDEVDIGELDLLLLPKYRGVDMTKEETMQSSLIMISKEEAYSSSLSIY